MDQWNLYTSGILVARIWFGEGGILHERRDPATAQFSERAVLTEEENQAYLSLLMLDITRVARQYPDYAKAFAAAGDEVRMASGEWYKHRGHGVYAQREVKFPHDILVADGRVAGFLCPNRENTGVLVLDGYEKYTVIAAWEAAYPGADIQPVEHLGTFDVATRDGVPLSTDVYLPGGRKGPVPAILIRTPYGKEAGTECYIRFVQRGYAVVIQDVRGRGGSGGEFIPNYYEVEDGDDTLNWIAAQAWSTQKVGMIGASYLGYVQWAAAASGNPYLHALVSISCAGSAFVDVPRRGGCFTSGMLAWAFAVSQKAMRPDLMLRDDWEDVLNIRPLGRIAEQALGHSIPFLDEWFRHPDCDSFWKRSDWQARSSGAEIPALIMSGWFDDNGMGTTQALELVHGFPAEKRKVILGPWIHSANTMYDVHGVPMGVCALRYDLDLIFLQWFDSHLKGADNGIGDTPRVEYYTLGQDRWKTAENWPVPSCRPIALYLDGDGQLSFAPAEREGADSYDYDPRDPSTNIIDMSENELEVPEDYTREEERADVLCYTTPPLERDLTVTGELRVELYISSDAVDTDFVVRVTDVDGSGRSIKLADGMMGAKYREGFKTPVFMEPGKTYPLLIRTTKLSNTFRKGHCIRLTITSSAKNFIFPNSNTYGGFDSAETVVARNTIHHGGAFPSKVTLMIEPEG